MIVPWLARDCPWPMLAGTIVVPTVRRPKPSALVRKHFLWLPQCAMHWHRGCCSAYMTQLRRSRWLAAGMGIGCVVGGCSGYAGSVGGTGGAWTAVGGNSAETG